VLFFFSGLHQELPGVPQGGPHRRVCAGAARVPATPGAEARPTDEQPAGSTTAATAAGSATAAPDSTYTAAGQL